MKKNIYLIVFIVAAIFGGCQDEEIKVESGQAEFIHAHSARINGIMQHNGNDTDYPVFFLSKTPRPGPENILIKPDIEQAGYYYLDLGVLEDNTTYYYKLCVNNDENGDILCGGVKSFTTPKSQTFTDERDGQEYEYVEIGNQTWMAENLNYASDQSVAFEDEEGHTPYGRAYFYEEHEDICPAGWHVPSDEEWQTLEKRMGMTDSLLNKTGNRGYLVGTKLMQPNELTMNEKESRIRGNNQSGLSILPFGGDYNASRKEEFRKPYSRAKYMTSSKAPNQDGMFFFYREFAWGDSEVRRSYFGDDDALYVRCLKD